MINISSDCAMGSINYDAYDSQRPESASGVNFCECVLNAKAVEDFHAQISNVAATLLDEFRLTFQYRL